MHSYPKGDNICENILKYYKVIYNDKIYFCTVEKKFITLRILYHYTFSCSILQEMEKNDDN